MIPHLESIYYIFHLEYRTYKSYVNNGQTILQFVRGNLYCFQLFERSETIENVMYFILFEHIFIIKNK